MAEISEAAIERRAKALAEKDGYAWRIEFQPSRPGEKLVGHAPLTDKQRKEYLDRARAERAKEAGDA